MTSLKSTSHKIAFKELGNQLEKDYGGLLSYLEKLPKERPLKDSFPSLLGMYNALISEFRKAAEHCVHLANEIIPEAEKQVKACAHFPGEYYYQEVLKKIADHVRLLAQLYFSLDHPPSASSGGISTFDAIQAIISEGSKLIPGSPVLIPIQTSQFMYVHLNYADAVGIIGIPPYALTRYSELPILYNEMAGYGVALQRASGRLESQAENLQYKLKARQCGSQNLWDSYRDLYEQSVSQNDVRVKIHINPKSIGIDGYSKILNYFDHSATSSNVDHDMGWQVRWLGEFLEDLFGLRYLGELMRDSLEWALVRAYETSAEIGDYGHPPPKLRLMVADEYLRSTFSQQDVLDSIDEVTDATVCMAKVIAAHNLMLPQMGAAVSSSDPHIRDLVRRTAMKVLQSPPETPLQGTASDDFTNAEAIGNAFAEFKKQTQIDILPSTQIWDQVGLERPDAVPGSGPRDALVRLKRLRSITFTDTDESAPAGGIPLLPLL